jgi:hypothetical protein
MLPLFIEFTSWITTMPEPAGLLLLGFVLISTTFRRRRVQAAEFESTSRVVRRRISSATRLTAQSGHS